MSRTSRPSQVRVLSRLALVAGFLAIRHEWDGLFVFSLTAPYVLAVLGVFAILAID